MDLDSILSRPDLITLRDAVAAELAIMAEENANGADYTPADVALWLPEGLESEVFELGDLDADWARPLAREELAQLWREEVARQAA